LNKDYPVNLYIERENIFDNQHFLNNLSTEDILKYRDNVRSVSHLFSAISCQKIIDLSDNINWPFSRDMYKTEKLFWFMYNGNLKEHKIYPELLKIVKQHHRFDA